MRVRIKDIISILQKIGTEISSGLEEATEKGKVGFEGLGQLIKNQEVLLLFLDSLDLDVELKQIKKPGQSTLSLDVFRSVSELEFEVPSNAEKIMKKYSDQSA